MESMEQDTDPFAPVNFTTLDQEKHLAFYQYLKAILHFIYLVLNLLSIASYSFVIYNVLHYKKLRNLLNTSILHLAATGIAYFSVQVYSILVNVFDLWDHHQLVMITFQMQTTCMILYMAMAVLVYLNWFVAGFKPILVERHWKIIIISVYVVAIIEYIIHFIYSEYKHIYRTNICYVIYFTIFVLFVFLNIFRRYYNFTEEHSKNSYACAVSSFVILSLFTSSLAHLFDMRLEDFTSGVVYLIFVIGHLAWFANGVIVTYWLYIKDKTFRRAFEMTIKKIDDDLEEELVKEEDASATATAKVEAAAQSVSTNAVDLRI